MNQKGFIPIVILVGIAIATSAVGGAVYLGYGKIKEFAKSNGTQLTESPTGSKFNIPSLSPVSAPGISSPQPTKKSQSSSKTSQTTPTPTPTSQSKQTTSTVTTTPKPTPAPKVICEVYPNIASGSAGLTVSYYYGARWEGTSESVGNDYVTNVQWDFNGDGNWDTPLNVASQRPTHTFWSSGNYKVKMHLQTVKGLTSDICTGTAIVN